MAVSPEPKPAQPRDAVQRHGKELIDFLLGVLTEDQRRALLTQLLEVAVSSVGQGDVWPLAFLLGDWEEFAETERDPRLRAFWESVADQLEGQAE